MSDWISSSLSDVADVVGRGITPKYLKDGSYVVLNQKCIRDGVITFGLARHHDGAGKPVKIEKELRVGDVLVNSTGVGTLGRTARIRRLSAPTTADSHISIIRPKPTTDPGWLGYSLFLNEPKIEAMAEGSTGQTELSRHHLARLNLTVPSLPEQQRIGETLGVLDDKIESNRRSIDLGRDLMRALYSAAISDRSVKASFVLTPVLGGTPSRDQPLYWKGDIPWASAKDVAASLTGYVESTAESITQAGVDSSAAKVLPAGSIVMTARGTVGALARLAEPMAFNQSCYALVPKGSVSAEVLYLAIEGAIQRIRDAGHGTVFNTVNMATFDQIELALPSDPSQELLGQLEGLSASVLHRVRESTRLSFLRDTLLPELLSGHIRVPEAREAFA